MTPQCRTALTTLVALISIIATLLAAAVVSVDSRVAAAVAPIKSDIEVLKAGIMTADDWRKVVI